MTYHHFQDGWFDDILDEVQEEIETEAIVIK